MPTVEAALMIPGMINPPSSEYEFIPCGMVHESVSPTQDIIPK